MDSLLTAQLNDFALCLQTWLWNVCTKLFPVNLPINFDCNSFCICFGKEAKKWINFIFILRFINNRKLFPKTRNESHLIPAHSHAKMKEKTGFEFTQWIRNENQCVSITYSKTVRIPFACLKWAHHTIPIPPINVRMHTHVCARQIARHTCIEWLCEHSGRYGK